MSFQVFQEAVREHLGEGVQCIDKTSGAQLVGASTYHAEGRVGQKDVNYVVAVEYGGVWEVWYSEPAPTEARPFERAHRCETRHPNLSEAVRDFAQELHRYLAR